MKVTSVDDELIWCCVLCVMFSTERMDNVCTALTWTGNFLARISIAASFLPDEVKRLDKYVHYSMSACAACTCFALVFQTH